MSVEPLFASLYKGGGLPQGKPEGFHRVIWNLKRTCVTFYPLFASLEKGGGLPQGKPEGFHRVIWNLNRACVTF